jgi:speckle-type POZ protein
MFEVDMVEKKENVLNITDIDFDVMQEIVRYIYTDQVEHIEDFAPALLLAADKVLLKN